VEAHLVSIGTELVTGQTVDTNAAWLAARLSQQGVSVAGHCTVPDLLEPIVDALTRMAAAHDLVVVTGGLGPTEDDLTRAALARALGVELRTDDDALAELHRFFRNLGREMPPANAVQALVPVGARALPNRAGTAPGIHARIGRAEVFALPGVPREMEAMFEAEVLPRLASKGIGRAAASASLHTFGTTESELGERVRDLMARGRNPSVGTTTGEGIITLRIHASDVTPEAARERLERDVAEIRDRLGSRVFGRDGETLAVAVADLLRSRHATLATAESCTGGLVTKLLTDVPGASDWLLEGVVTYSNAAKTRRLGVPPELIAALARGAREQAGSDYAVSLTGIAGPTGGTEEKPVGLVYLGLAHAGGVKTREIRCGSHQPRAEVRVRAAHAALNLLRLELLSERQA
jgi:nicotinamide-nucleotide amidase